LNLNSKGSVYCESGGIYYGLMYGFTKKGMMLPHFSASVSRQDDVLTLVNRETCLNPFTLSGLYANFEEKLITGILGFLLA
jgi:hypothetical protein